MIATDKPTVTEINASLLLVVEELLTMQPRMASKTFPNTVTEIYFMNHWLEWARRIYEQAKGDPQC